MVGTKVLHNSACVHQVGAGEKGGGVGGPRRTVHMAVWDGQFRAIQGFDVNPPLVPILLVVF